MRKPRKIVLSADLPPGNEMMKVVSADTLPVGAEFRLMVGAEIMIVNRLAGRLLFVSRAQDGTKAAFHAAGKVAERFGDDFMSLARAPGSVELRCIEASVESFNNPMANHSIDMPIAVISAIYKPEANGDPCNVY